MALTAKLYGPGGRLRPGRRGGRAFCCGTATRSSWLTWTERLPSAFAPVIDRENGVAGVRGTLETVRRVRANLRRYTPNGLEQSAFMQLRDPPRCPPELLRLRTPRPHQTIWIC